MEDWLSHVPSPEVADLTGRLRGPHDDDFYGAFWELYLSESFTSAGHVVTWHPEIEGSSRRPDFFIEGDRFTGFVEATVAFAPYKERMEDRRIHQIRDALETMELPEIFLDLDIQQTGPSSPSMRRLRRAISEWATALPIDELRRSRSTRRAERHTLTWAEGGWQLSITPIPKKPGAGTPTDPVVGMHGKGAGMLHTVDTIRAGLLEKASRYGDLAPHPYIVALLVPQFMADEDDLVSTLFGSPAIKFSIDTDEHEWVRQNDGFWVGLREPKHTNVSGVLYATEVFPWSVASAQLQLWLNPWALRPMDGWLSVWTLKRPILGDGIEEKAATISPAELFGLGVEWPGRGSAFGALDPDSASDEGS